MSTPPEPPRPAEAAQRAQGRRPRSEPQTSEVGQQGERSRTAGRAEQALTVLELLRRATRHFAERGIDTPRLDAELLLASALGVDRLQLYLHFEKPVVECERAVYRELVRRRAQQRVPVAQMLGCREFWSLPLAVTPEVLIPRPETEALVAAALERLPDAEAALSVLDVGTGCGAVALALASERPRARVVASDVSAPALELAARNAEALELAPRLRFAQGDLFEPVAGERFDLVVSNPPYLAESERAGLAPELAHEPEGALFAGPDGLRVLRRLVAGVSACLAPGGVFACELAPAQAPEVADWCRAAGLLDVRVHRDLAKRPRVVSGLLAPDRIG